MKGAVLSCFENRNVLYSSDQILQRRRQARKAHAATGPRSKTGSAARCTRSCTASADCCVSTFLSRGSVFSNFSLSEHLIENRNSGRSTHDLRREEASRELASACTTHSQPGRTVADPTVHTAALCQIAAQAEQYVGILHSSTGSVHSCNQKREIVFTRFAVHD